MNNQKTMLTWTSFITSQGDKPNNHTTSLTKSIDSNVKQVIMKQLKPEQTMATSTRATKKSKCKYKVDQNHQNKDHD